MFRRLFALLVCAAALPAVGCGNSDSLDQCLSATRCAGNEDCQNGYRCNLKLVIPVCQLLYCGPDGSDCSEDALCAGRSCSGGVCTCAPECADRQCGPDPICGVSCGECSSGDCVAGRCQGGITDNGSPRDIPYSDVSKDVTDVHVDDVPYSDNGPRPDSGDTVVTTDVSKDLNTDPGYDGSETGCVVDCGDWECGESNCPGVMCGVCPQNSECGFDHQCVVTCYPNCNNRECGTDGCGSLCGYCEYGSTCSVDGRCIVESCDVEVRCQGRECGASGCFDDGRPITCGTCDGNKVCNESASACEAMCSWPDGLPETWSATGVANSLRVPMNPTEKVPCFDFTGDGVGDCGLTGVASQLNPALQDMMTEGTTAIMLEFEGVSNFTATASFDLNLLFGNPAVSGTLSGDMYVDPDSYLPETCQPLVYFRDSSISGGKLYAGPSQFAFNIPLGDSFVITIHLLDTSVKATVAGSSAGVSASNGVISGVLTKQELNGIVDSIDVECKKDPVPDSVKDICPYIGVARGALPMLFDMHQVGDGTYVAKDAQNPGDASSVCLLFTMANSEIIGYSSGN